MVVGNLAPGEAELQALPEVCPRCRQPKRAQFRCRDLKKFYSRGNCRKLRSAALRTGLNATTQLVADRAVYAIGESGDPSR